MSRAFIATVDGTDLSIAVTPQGSSDQGRESWQVEIDGRTFIADAARVRPGTWSLIVDGRSLLVDIDERAGKAVAIVGRNEFAIDIDDAQRKRLARAVAGRSAQTARGGVVRAPIAGKVVKLLVAEGDEVESTAGVLVLEAMKMENQIKAERAGTVSTIHVQEGQSVETGDKLVSLT